MSDSVSVTASAMAGLAAGGLRGADVFVSAREGWAAFFFGDGTSTRTTFFTIGLGRAVAARDPARLPLDFRDLPFTSVPSLEWLRSDFARRLQQDACLRAR